MKNRQHDVATQAQNAATAAIAAASTTPFKTAFKITMGIALAQLATLALVITGFALLIGVAAVIITVLK